MRTQHGMSSNSCILNPRRNSDSPIAPRNVFPQNSPRCLSAASCQQQLSPDCGSLTPTQSVQYADATPTRRNPAAQSAAPGRARALGPQFFWGFGRKRGTFRGRSPSTVSRSSSSAPATAKDSASRFSVDIGRARMEATCSCRPESGCFRFFPFFAGGAASLSAGSSTEAPFFAAASLSFTR